MIGFDLIFLSSNQKVNSNLVSVSRGLSFFFIPLLNLEEAFAGGITAMKASDLIGLLIFS